MHQCYTQHHSLRTNVFGISVSSEYFIRFSFLHLPFSDYEILAAKGFVRFIAFNSTMVAQRMLICLLKTGRV